MTTGDICGAKDPRDGKPCRERPGNDLKRCDGHRDIACYCCGEVDDPNGPGPAINTGFCAECATAGCPDQTIGARCATGVLR